MLNTVPELIRKNLKGRSEMEKIAEVESRSRDNLRVLARWIATIPLIFVLSGCILPDEDDVCCCSAKGKDITNWSAGKNLFGKVKSCGRDTTCVGPVFTGKDQCNGLKALNASLSFTLPKAQAFLTSTLLFVEPQGRMLLAKNDLESPKNSASQTTTDDIVPEYPGTCSQECQPGKNSPYCMNVPQGTAIILSAQIDKLAVAFRANDKSVKKVEIMKVFDVKDDPCNRSDTNFLDETIRNTGEACSFQMGLKVGPISELPITISMPQELHAKIVDNENLTVKFSHRSTAPSLTINDPLDSDFGGTIQTLQYSPSLFMVGTERGCIAIRK